MRRLRNTFLKGLAAVLPVTLTIYLVYWLGTKAESVLGGMLRVAFPESYWPGLGLLVGFVFVLVVGALVDAYIFRRVIRVGESLLARIPLVKTIFGALKDFTRFLPASGEKRDLKRVVLWRLGSARLIGFVTEEHISKRLLDDPNGNVVAVYFPMSYTIGGYTLYLPKSELESTELAVEEAMRLVLIGGVSARSTVHPRAATAG